MRQRLIFPTRCFALGMLAAALALRFPAVAAGQDQAGADARSAALLEAAKEAYQAYEKKMFRQLLNPNCEIPYQWSRRWLDAQRAIDKSKDKQIAAYSAHLDRMKEMETLVAKGVGAGQVAKVELTAVKFYRIEAEKWLAEAKGGAGDKKADGQTNVQKIRDLEAALVEKDARIAELARNLKRMELALLPGETKKKNIGPPPVERGPEHKVLESLVGVFDAKDKVFLNPKKPNESTGVMTRTMVLDGNFLQESYKGEFFGKPFTGVGLIGWDVGRKQYTSAWCDSTSTTMTVLYGTWDADKKTMTMVGEDFDPGSKKKMKARDLLKIVSADEQFFVMHRQPEGEDAEIKIMEITYRRKAEKK